MRSLSFLALAAPIFVSAQQVHLVVVGDANGTTKFTPEAIFADVGDVVTFEFQQKNHSVVQSSLADPCGAKDGGFNSGFMPVGPDVTSDFPQYNITVADKNPIWVFCGQTNPVSHCGKGMVFAVNCGADGAPNSFSNFKAAALATASDTASSSNPYGAPPPTDSSSGSSTPDSSDSVLTPASPSDTNVAGASSVGTGNTIKIIVGGNSSLTFDPPHVQANIGDVLLFEFQSKNHTVTQSTFASPCLKLNNATSGESGFDSGFMPVTAGLTQFPTFNITVNDASPIWAYCKQRNPISHCGQGMVFAVNTNESSNKSYGAFAALAKQQNGTQTNGSSTDTGTTSDNSAAIRASTTSALTVLSIIGAVTMMV
jgi:plastocyanin